MTFRPWIGTFGGRFHSESLLEDTASALLPGERGALNELSGQASAAGLQGFGLGGEWRPFGNGFRLDFAMYLDSSEPGMPGTRGMAGFASPSDSLAIPTRDFEAVPYVGLGWRANSAGLAGLDVNLDVGAFLPGEASFRDDSCLNPDSPLTECGAATFGGGRGKLSGSFRKFEWHPVVSLGIEYRF